MGRLQQNSCNYQWNMARFLSLYFDLISIRFQIDVVCLISRESLLNYLGVMYLKYTQTLGAFHYNQGHCIQLEL